MAPMGNPPMHDTYIGVLYYTHIYTVNSLCTYKCIWLSIHVDHGTGRQLQSGKVTENKINIPIVKHQNPKKMWNGTPIKTHSRVSAAKKDVRHTSVLFTGTAKSPF